MFPSWRNARKSREGISKRLDRFLVAKRIVEVGKDEVVGS